MQADRLETIFRRDLDRLPVLGEDEWTPGADPVRRAPRAGALVLAVLGTVLLIGIGLRAGPDRTTPADAPTPTPYFAVAEPGMAALPSAQPSGDRSGEPRCRPGDGQSPLLSITFPPPPGDLPGTGAASPEEAFRLTYPATTDVSIFRPFGPAAEAPVWFVAGQDTYIAQLVGTPGGNNWFVHPAKFLGCRTPPSGRGPKPSP